MSLHSEIHEQPDCLVRLLQRSRIATEEIAEAVAAEDIRFVFIAARGTSDNAARYANYVWGAINGLPVALAAPSLFTYYNHPPRLRGSLVVGISQSGRSPDIVSVITEGKQQGCLTLAITNDAGSPLAKAADFVLNIEAGPENAVAATKTYTAQLMGVAMLAAAMKRDGALWEELLRVPDRIQASLGAESEIANIAPRFRGTSKSIVLSRGFNYATACEWALKLKELASMEAEPYSSADFVHGPIAMVDGRFPIFAVVAKGAVAPQSIQVLKTVKEERSAEILMISNMNEALSMADISLPLPSEIPEWLTPLVAIVPAQLFCHHLAVAKNLDTESPRGIKKITETR